MTEVVSVDRDGPDAARGALERCIGAGGVAVFPADTVYGLACDPLDEGAVARIRELKRREEDKPSAVLYFSPLAMRELVAGLGPNARDAVGALLPGPVTLVLANPEGRYPLAGAGDTLGVRLIEGPLAGAMTPVLQTSANLTGEPAAASFDDVPAEIVTGADLAIDGGELGGAASTVIDLSAVDADGAWRVLREGAMPVAEVERRLEALGDGA